MPGTAALTHETITNNKRTLKGLQPKYSAMPPITPAIILYSRERINFLLAIPLSYAT